MSPDNVTFCECIKFNGYHMAESNLQFSSQNSVNETLARLHVNTAAVVEIRFLRGFRNSTESSRKASKIPTDLRREIEGQRSAF